MNEKTAPKDSVAIGYQAAEIAGKALEELGRAMIRQKALDVARQIEIYLRRQDFSSLAELRQDAELSSIAVTKIGRAGFTVVHDTHAINLFHHDPIIRGQNLRQFAFTFPQFWDIIERGLSSESDGYYDWPDVDGVIQRKYMVCAPLFPSQIAPAGLVVAATIAIDEFLQPSREISQRIITLTERVDEYNRAEQRRHERMRSINRLSRTISSYLNADELLSYVAKTMADAFQIRSVRIFLASGAPGTLSLAAEAGEPPCRNNGNTYRVLDPCIAETVAITGKYYLSQEPDPAAGTVLPAGHGQDCPPVRLVVPIKLGRTILGVLDLINEHGKDFREIDLFSIWPLADQIGTALENARLHSELREAAVVEERNRIAREIHDTLAQGFAGISMLVETAKQSVKHDEQDQTEQILDRIRALAKEKLSEARRSVQALRPNITIQESLQQLVLDELTQLARDAMIETHCAVSGEEQLISQEIKLAVLRICQEALHNIQKHSNAGHVNVALSFTPNALTLVVQDDGVGFDPQTPVSNSVGISVMRERARLVGGSVRVSSVMDSGTEVRVDIPL